ncbi:MAG: squalene synthase HpnC [gamma proteobacterium symbiont of Bathyaustriella thionipta]|nr:squalene synthase HpnC [gamma proteobacterium symbiont of Bathyaustriella thionipta]MCU7949543.1 squalene synthase HpnC [gamma proteobacterium symbiont of Bathyaustriella thionipta]MCU7952325.1 squalene synthase HpnC [gamma proteobacterium symbiont of Bathyaustriella thionipta]MCU7956143.1 squalene synthase HpnC [gamma proteobacterium symbiont of Bathyaustriella thionipta]MCU7967152.1 squalene synthase HpnC [gamma proteobacterium symbiont of Bathyaustriella thionipta]
MPAEDSNKDNAYKFCMAIAQNHYENFPVASKLLSRQLRFPISAVYAFARSADDFADEGDLSNAQRLTLLEEYTTELDSIEQGMTQWSIHKGKPFIHNSENPIFIALADVIHQYKIPIRLFYDLLRAFKQDVTTRRYSSFDDIHAYCQLSANPVGQILLHLHQSATEENLNHSDAICTGLQLINFYQDIAQDIDENDRLYLPLDEMKQFNVSENDIKKHINNFQTQKLIEKQLLRTQNLYFSGNPLCSNLSGRFALEIRMIYAGGQLILEKLQRNTANIYLRPRLTHRDKLKLIWQALFF